MQFLQNPFLLEFQYVIVIRGAGTVTFLENSFGQGFKNVIVIVIFRKLIPENKKLHAIILMTRVMICIAAILNRQRVEFDIPSNLGI